MTTKYYCGECGKECDWVQRDFGIGGYEFWGASGFHSNIQTVSKCCDGDIYSDPELEEQVEFSAD
jgi:hypothetical protein